MEPNVGVIRRATVADIERIHEIAVAAWTPIHERCRHIVGDEIYRDMWGEWQVDYVRYKKEQVEDRNRFGVVITELNGGVVGFVTWHILNPKAAEVGRNAVDPQFQGRGIGTCQVRKVLEFAKGQGCKGACVFTWRDPTHAPARAQYRAAGLTRPITGAMFMNSLWAVAKSPKRSGLEVVAGSKEHEAAIMEIVDAVWGPVVTENERLTGGIYGLCYPDPLGRKKEAIRKRLVENPQGLCTVLERGRPIGFCLLDMDVPKSYGTISQLGVLPSARRHGAATALCMEAFRIFRERGLRHVRFMVGPGENTEATRWLCSSIGLHREIPTVGLFGPL